MNGSLGSPVQAPCPLPALPQATPFTEPGAPRGGTLVGMQDSDEHTYKNVSGKTSFPPPQKVPL